MDIFEKYVSKKEILLILFNNEKENCISNINPDSKLNVKENIIYNSKKYNIKKYNNYNNIIIPVYKK